MTYKERYDAAYKEYKNADLAMFAALYQEPIIVPAPVVNVKVEVPVKFLYAIIILLTIIAMKGFL